MATLLTWTILGLGSNLGSRETYLLAASGLLAERRDLRVIGVSRVFETDPVGPAQPRFLNAAVRIESDLSPEAILDVSAGVEGLLTLLRFGRISTEEAVDLYKGYIARIPHVDEPALVV